jgi:hypothetical protein
VQATIADIPSGKGGKARVEKKRRSPDRDKGQAVEDTLASVDFKVGWCCVVLVCISAQLLIFLLIRCLSNHYPSVYMW